MPRVNEDARPNPDELLRLAKSDDSGRGRLKVYLGMAAGVGKTMRMLEVYRAFAEETLALPVIAGDAHI